MNVIKTKLHGMMDYAFGGLLLLPWISDFYAKAQDTWLLAFAGTLLLFYSLLTDYEFGLIKWFSMKLHLVLDILVGLLLVFSPAILPMRHYAYNWPVLLGFAMLVTVILSARVPYIITKKDANITLPQ